MSRLSTLLIKAPEPNSTSTLIFSNFPQDVIQSYIRLNLWPYACLPLYLFMSIIQVDKAKNTMPQEVKLNSLFYISGNPYLQIHSMRLKQQKEQKWTDAQSDLTRNILLIKLKPVIWMWNFWSIVLLSHDPPAFWSLLQLKTATTVITSDYAEQGLNQI